MHYSNSLPSDNNRSSFNINFIGKSDHFSRNMDGKEKESGNWSSDVVDILDKIRINSIVLSNEHKKKYFKLSRRIKWFRIPVIVFSALGSLFGFGLSPYIPQIMISEITSVLSLLVGIIGSLEMFLGINHKMENELLQSKELYLFSIEIQKTLLLDVQHRHIDGIVYLEDKFNAYTKFIQDSYLLECKVIDTLTPLPVYFQNKLNDIPSDKHTLISPRRRSRGVRINKIEPIIDINDLPVIHSPPKRNNHEHAAEREKFVQIAEPKHAVSQKQSKNSMEQNIVVNNIESARNLVDLIHKMEDSYHNHQDHQDHQDHHMSFVYRGPSPVPANGGN